MKIAIIGCGAIAQVHAKSIAAIAQGCASDSLHIRESEKGCAGSGAEYGMSVWESEKGGEGSATKPYLAAAADCEMPRAEKLAREYGAKPYRDWQEMLEIEKPDAVHICTPHALHTPMAATALRKGIHVFAEKPPVISRVQYAELESAVQNAQGRARLAVCFQNRLNESVQYAKRILEEGKLGAVKGVRGFVTWRRDADYYADSPWRGRLDTEGGGALINQGIHTLDLMQYLVGESFACADAVLGNFHLKGRIEVEDTLSAYVEYPHAQAVFYATTAYAADKEPLIEAECERGTLRIEGETVTIRSEERTEDHSGGKPLAAEADEAQRQICFPQKECFGKVYWGAAHGDAIAGFYRSIAEGTPYLLDFEQTKESVKLMLAIYEAARAK